MGEASQGPQSVQHVPGLTSMAHESQQMALWPHTWPDLRLGGRPQAGSPLGGEAQLRCAQVQPPSPDSGAAGAGRRGGGELDELWPNSLG